MTQKEKINFSKNVITKLYEGEGRTVSYIARLLDVDRSTLSKQIRAWELVKAQRRHNSPSTQKFINKHTNYIIARLRESIPISQIAESLNISRDKLYYIIKASPRLSREKEDYDNRKYNKKEAYGKAQNYFENLPGEQWKEILGFEGYYVSNMGRFKRYLKTYDCYSLLACTPNSRNGRLYVSLVNSDGKRKNLMAARLVAHAFCDGYSAENNTVDHKDMDITNNRATNLEWVSQAENNRRKYEKLPGNGGFGSRNGRFKDIVLNGNYHFKTIRAMAKFLGVSESQAGRYISGETVYGGRIELTY